MQGLDIWNRVLGDYCSRVVFRIPKEQQRQLFHLKSNPDHHHVQPASESPVWPASDVPAPRVFATWHDAAGVGTTTPRSDEGMAIELSTILTVVNKTANLVASMANAIDVIKESQARVAASVLEIRDGQSLLADAVVEISEGLKKLIVEEEGTAMLMVETQEVMKGLREAMMSFLESTADPKGVQFNREIASALSSIMEKIDAARGGSTFNKTQYEHLERMIEKCILDIHSMHSAVAAIGENTSVAANAQIGQMKNIGDAIKHLSATVNMRDMSEAQRRFFSERPPSDAGHTEMVRGYPVLN